MATISTGLPFKEKKVLDVGTIKSEKGLRDLIIRNLKKEIHPGTKPSVDFIKHILDQAYDSGMTYDVTDLRSAIFAFANNSTNQNLACLKIVQQMKFKSEETAPKPVETVKEDRIVFYDIEVFPNLFVICWKFQGDANMVRMINPKPQEVEALFSLKLVGFNNRRYDNHMLYAAYLGYNNEQLYKMSKKIIDEKNVNALFGEAYNISYTDIYDFSSKRQGLKKFEIELGIHHMELDLPWDEPVPKELWGKVVDYCANDVLATEATFEARKADFLARQILADLSGLTVNDTTQRHTAQIVFEGDKNPQREFVYTDLSKDFPGYTFDKGKSTYRGEEVGEGGYVYAEPGMHENVVLLDVASMHPTSIKELNAFGEYTPNFWALVEARLAIKRKDFDTARKLFNGRLAPFLNDPTTAAGLADALKIAINIVYGLTSASFTNPFRDIRNKDNIVAKRGALFMIDLKHAVQEQGFTVAHIKTDSIKIPDATPEIIEFVKQFGEKWGYVFEYDPEKDFYDAMCLVNDAVYIARKGDKFTAVGAQFQHPYIFKTLFTEEPITFNDLCETKQVSQGAIYMDFDYAKPGTVDENNMHFVGRTGSFVPVKEGHGGGVLYRVKDGKSYAVAGTKGYLWLEAEIAKELPIDIINMDYFVKLAEEARNDIDYWGEYTRFLGR